MCTLSFLPGNDGYMAAMNRDELRVRPAALPPAIPKAGGLSLVYPRESGGGTWIGANSRGVFFALLNWYSMEAANLGEKRKSRGEIIPHLLQTLDGPSAERALHRLDLTGVYPFRLFGFFPAEREIREWCWDTRCLAAETPAWRRQHWFSSSRSDRLAAAQRGAACNNAWNRDPLDPAAWLRTLHASHIPEPGPFSICVHRQDAATVSYTEVEWRRGYLQMRYLSGNPCETAKVLDTWKLPISAPVPARA
jgi:hypothetical protein